MTSSAPTIYTHALRTIHGDETTLVPYRGQVMLIVNVASGCMFTRQYAALEALYQHYRERGFVVLGFPCNQFGHQEPGNAEEIQAFCTSTFGVTFPLFSKLEVNGASAHPLYVQLKSQRSGVFGSAAIKWNFTKFLVGRDGAVQARFAPQTRPSALSEPIERALGEPAAALTRRNA